MALFVFHFIVTFNYLPGHDMAEILLWLMLHTNQSPHGINELCAGLVCTNNALHSDQVRVQLNNKLSSSSISLDREES